LLHKSGHLIVFEHLEPAETATMVGIRNADLSNNDGLFAETKEQLDGFWLVDARDLTEAFQTALKFPSARIGGVEVRPVADCLQQ
jgi:hypothetical protein